MTQFLNSFLRNVNWLFHLHLHGYSYCRFATDSFFLLIDKKNISKCIQSLKVTIEPIWLSNYKHSMYSPMKVQSNEIRNTIHVFSTMSCCKFWIYWVGVNTKFTTWQQSCCKFCIYTHPVNSKFTTWQLHKPGVLSVIKNVDMPYALKFSSVWLQRPLHIQ